MTGSAHVLNGLLCTALAANLCLWAATSGAYGRFPAGILRICRCFYLGTLPWFVAAMVVLIRLRRVERKLGSGLVVASWVLNAMLTLGMGCARSCHFLLTGLYALCLVDFWASADSRRRRIFGVGVADRFFDLFTLYATMYKTGGRPAGAIILVGIVCAAATVLLGRWSSGCRMLTGNGTCETRLGVRILQKPTHEMPFSDDDISRLTELGFSVKNSRQALIDARGDLQLAINHLLDL